MNLILILIVTLYINYIFYLGQFKNSNLLLDQHLMKHQFRLQRIIFYIIQTTKQFYH